MASRVSKTRLIVAIVVVAVIAIMAIVLSCNSSSSSQAPDFTLPTMTKGNITLSELKGTPIVLNFWSIGCYWCRYQLPFLEKVARQSEGEIKVVAVNIADNAAKIQKFFRDYEPAMIIALDKNGEAFIDYCLAYNNPGGYTPFTLFIDSEGLVQSVKIGAFASEAELRQTLTDVFGITIP